MAGAAKKLEAEYYIPHLSQAPMEPPAALVRIVDGRCEAWSCVQSPQVTRTRLAERLGIPEDKVTVNVTLLGGGFGRKSKPDFVIEAGLCSKAMDGAPVQAHLDARGRHPATASTTPSRWSGWRPASTLRARWWPGCTGAPRPPSARSS